MKLFAGKALLLPLVLAGTFAVGLPQAEAQSLFEHLFGGGIRNQRMEDGGYRQRSGRDDGRYYGNRQGYRPGRPRRPVARKPAAVAKISAPSYYNYKAAALQRVDFAPLAAIGQSASLDQATSGTAFREAVAGLAGYELFAEPEIAKAMVDYLFRQSGFHLGHRQRAQRARAAMRCGCSGKRRATAFRRPTTPSPSRRPAFRLPTPLRRKSELIRFEMALSARVLRYAHDAEGGRIDPNRISGYHDFPEKPFDMVGGAEDRCRSRRTRAAGWSRGIRTTPSTRRCASSSKR